MDAWVVPVGRPLHRDVDAAQPEQVDRRYRVTSGDGGRSVGQRLSGERRRR